MIPLFNAVIKNDTEEILKLLREGKNINERDRDGRTALMDAAIEQSASIVSF